MSPCSKLKGVGGVGVPGSWYDLILRKSEKEEIWFGMDDCSARMLRVLVAYYWLAICYPFSFFYFLVRYNMLWEGTACGLFFTVCFWKNPWLHNTPVLLSPLKKVYQGSLPHHTRISMQVKKVIVQFPKA